MIVTSSHLQRPYFQTRSHPEVLGGCEFGDGVGVGDIIQLGTEAIPASKRDYWNRACGSSLEKSQEERRWELGRGGQSEEGKEKRTGAGDRGQSKRVEVGNRDRQGGDILGTKCVAGDRRSVSAGPPTIPLAPPGGNVSISTTLGVPASAGVRLQPCPGPGSTAQRAADGTARSLGGPSPATCAGRDACADAPSRTQPRNSPQLPANSSH